MSNTGDNEKALSTGNFVAAQKPAPQITLLAYHRGGAAAVLLREGQPLVVGRSPDADLTLRDEGVSRRHARFELVDGQVWVVDLESTNGVLVNGQKVTRSLVKPGQEVTLGAVTVTLPQLAREQVLMQGLDSHELFLALLAYECGQSKVFHRAVGVIMVRAVEGAEDLRRWFPRIQSQMRKVDRAAVFSPDTLELLLPETTREDVLRMAWSIAGGRHTRHSSLLCGVALFPCSAASSDELAEVAFVQLQRATRRSPVCISEAVNSRTETRDAGDKESPVEVSPLARNLYDLVRRLGQSEIPVLIVGETGSGKEVVARAIHAHSRRTKECFRYVNCAAVPGQLLESLLFGHVKGAFPGADQDTEGMLQTADRGTVLLDEIGELTPSAQAALLRFLDHQSVTRIGSTKETPVDVRILAATNRDLDSMCAAGSFREDLLYRINGMTVRVPPLRDRREDILPLAEIFLEQARQADRRDVASISAEAAALLVRYSWPGNVRELRNVIARAVVLCKATSLEPEHLSERIQSLIDDADREVEITEPMGSTEAKGNPSVEEKSQLSFRKRVRQVEADLIVEALRATQGSRSEAAKLLKIPLRTLTRKMATYGIRRLGYGIRSDEEPE